MKKTIIVVASLVLLLAFVGCEESISGVGGVRESISPASWTIGTWDLKAGDDIISSLVFTTDNLIWTAPSVGFNLKEMSGLPGVTLSDSEVSSTVYRITMSGDGLVQTYNFTKTSSDILTFSLITSGITQPLEGFKKR